MALKELNKLHGEAVGCLLAVSYIQGEELTRKEIDEIIKINT